MNTETERAMLAEYEAMRDALRELYRAVDGARTVQSKDEFVNRAAEIGLPEAAKELMTTVKDGTKAGVGKRMEITVSPRMEDALQAARKALRMRDGEE